MRRLAAVGGGLALAPVDRRDRELLTKIPMDEPVAVRISRGRSLPQHRLFWGLLDHVAKASVFENGERLLVALKIRLGRYDLMKMPSGKAVPVPHSIAFAAMDQSDFQVFMDDSIRLICEEVIPGTNSDTLIAEVQAMLDQPAEVR
jgi:hypothetical protein